MAVFTETLIRNRINSNFSYRNFNIYCAARTIFYTLCGHTYFEQLSRGSDTLSALISPNPFSRHVLSPRTTLHFIPETRYRPRPVHRDYVTSLIQGDFIFLITNQTILVCREIRFHYVLSVLCFSIISIVKHVIPKRPPHSEFDLTPRVHTSILVYAICRFIHFI